MSVSPHRPMFEGVDKTLLQLLQVIGDFDRLHEQQKMQLDAYQKALDDARARIVQLETSLTPTNGVAEMVAEPVHERPTKIK